MLSKDKDTLSIIIASCQLRSECRRNLFQFIKPHLGLGFLTLTIIMDGNTELLRFKYFKLVHLVCNLEMHLNLRDLPLTLPGTISKKERPNKVAFKTENLWSVFI